MSEDIFKMTSKELKKYNLIQKVSEKRITQKSAAEVLNLSTRQVRRIGKRYENKGPRGIFHQARGKASNRKFSNKFKREVLKIYRKNYAGFGPTLAREQLVQRHQIQIGREKLRQWLLEAGLWEKSRKKRPSRLWRKRRACFGELVQVDGSHHDWLEGRGPKFVLMAFIDDATSELFARFYDYEGTLPIMDSFYRYKQRYDGLPCSLYLDRHSTYRRSSDEKKASQFARAMEQLSVKLIHAHSPQAKGRIERVFRTLQDRLVKEMRLDGVKTKEEANQFLKHYLLRHNRRFRREPESDRNLHQDPSPGAELKQILSIQTQRLLRGDNTIRYRGKLYLITSPWEYQKPKQVQVQERIDGKLYLVDQEITLRYRQVQEPDFQHKTAA